MTPPEHPLRQIVKELDRVGIAHMLTGSFASTYHGELDLPYIERWVQELGLSTLWQRVKAEAGEGQTR